MLPMINKLEISSMFAFTHILILAKEGIEDLERLNNIK